MKQKKYVNNILYQRSCCYEIILYKDSRTINFDEIMPLVLSLYDNGIIQYWAYIYHDRDYNGDKLKKKHFHLLIKFRYDKSVNRFLQLLELKEKYKLPLDDIIVHSYRGALWYFIHQTKESSDKTVYSVNDIKSSDDSLTRSILSEKVTPDKNMIFLDIVHYINHSQDAVSMNDVLQYCISNGLEYVNSYRQFGNYRIYSDMVKERKFIKYE